MSLNEFMHPRNIYRVKPVFEDLAKDYPDLNKHFVKGPDGKAHFDFKNPDALRTLTTTLLTRDFNLRVTIPSDRLVPTLPLRVNYILWIEDLLSKVQDDCGGSETTEILGLDIGTGATCIYPLLGCRKNGWRFLATETDDEALQFATKNVEANQMKEKINLIKSTSDCILSEAVLRSANRRIDFSMCNPPFFRDDAEANSRTKRRKPTRPQPHALNRPKLSESTTDGGELAFVAKMIEESVSLQDKIRIYTTMFGKKSSATETMKRIAQIFDGECAGSFATTEFCQGRTMRWGLAWTFVADIHLDNVTPKRRRKEKSILPVGFRVPMRADGIQCTILDIREKVESMLDEVKIVITKINTEEDSCALHLAANANTWCHQRRKRRESKQGGDRSKLIKLESGEAAAIADKKSEEDHAETGTVPAVFEGMLFIRKTLTEEIIVEVQWLGGTLGKDCANQIVQFLKNKLR